MADLPEDRLRLARLRRNGGPQLSSPAGCAVIPRASTKLRAAVLRVALACEQVRRRSSPG
ncbi:hypothetical protein GDI0390 [Gluconacetobacter diazotrophicus PA1 5]|uniref:Uncharacterized protein n=1 Tax=Gluconacetobacter diazotrophicus (strain ATCC 49037 / DSM 5601 / CCUG 37298 / CIP 103539 / LMG 7603 / PAl5) TaxID=272568 RepID=A9H5H4_GLUDA|nr:hypothetical protein GDI0390 [Gluconacetobacter diazotrophicus PA1 5]